MKRILTDSLDVIGWLFIATYVLLGGYFKRPSTVDHQFLISTSAFIAYFSGFYFCYYFILGFFSKFRSHIFLTVGLISSFFFFLIIKYGLFISVLKWRGEFAQLTNFLKPIKYLVFDLYYFLPIIMLSFAIYFLKSERQRLRSAAHFKNIDELFELEVLEKKAKLDFANKILASGSLFATPLSQEITDVLSKLSSLCSPIDLNCFMGKIPVSEEITNVENLLSLHKLRFPKSFHVEIIIEKNAVNGSIPPMILLSLIKNAIKNGILDDPEKPLKIHIRCQQSKLTFSVTNHIKEENIDLSYEMPLTIIRSTLEILFPNFHQFFVNRDEHIFEVVLVMPIKQHYE